ncbi:hypothetical protein EVAR_96502_1 [Eumeta japonica]|uniref:Uncharacterized protein n=1 Tax=Eumeta variegata TaxID=151549 RepID=A0A4C1ZV13_EUMVA|nr:hypothetical protein EVAR_96502_1 [Eumeta japonica]
MESAKQNIPGASSPVVAVRARQQQKRYPARRDDLLRRPSLRSRPIRTTQTTLWSMMKHLKWISSLNVMLKTLLSHRVLATSNSHVLKIQCLALLVGQRGDFILKTEKEMNEDDDEARALTSSHCFCNQRSPPSDQVLDNQINYWITPNSPLNTVVITLLQWNLNNSNLVKIEILSKSKKIAIPPMNPKYAIILYQALSLVASKWVCSFTGQPNSCPGISFCDGTGSTPLCTVLARPALRNELRISIGMVGPGRSPKASSMMSRSVLNIPKLVKKNMNVIIANTRQQKI